MTPWPQLEQAYQAAGMSPEQIAQIKELWFTELTQQPQWQDLAPEQQLQYRDMILGPPAAPPAAPEPMPAAMGMVEVMRMLQAGMRARCSTEAALRMVSARG